MTNRFLSFLFSVALFLVSGCSLKSSDNIAQPSALVSIYALSPETPSLNIFVNDANIATGIPFGSYTLYNQIAAGETRLKAQTPSLDKVHDATFTTVEGNYYSVFLIDTSSTHIKSVVVKDNLAAPGDSVHLRFFNFSPTAPAVDIYSFSQDSTNRKTVWKNRSYDSLPPTDAINTFSTFKTGNYNFYVIKSGTIDTLVRFKNTSLTSPGNYTIVLEGKYKSSTGDDTTLQLGIRRH